MTYETQIEQRKSEEREKRLVYSALDILYDPKIKEKRDGSNSERVLTRGSFEIEEKVQDHGWTGRGADAGSSRYLTVKSFKVVMLKAKLPHSTQGDFEYHLESYVPGEAWETKLDQLSSEADLESRACKEAIKLVNLKEELDLVSISLGLWGL